MPLLIPPNWMQVTVTAWAKPMLKYHGKNCEACGRDWPSHRKDTGKSCYSSNKVWACESVKMSDVAAAVCQIEEERQCDKRPVKLTVKALEAKIISQQNERNLRIKKCHKLSKEAEQLMASKENVSEVQQCVKCCQSCVWKAMSCINH